MSTGTQVQIPQSQPPALKVEFVPRIYRFHFLTEQELDDFASIGNISTVSLSSLMLCLGLVAAFFSVIYTSGSTLSDRTYAVYTGLAWFSTLASIVCGALFAVSFRRVQARRQELKLRPSVPFTNFGIPASERKESRTPTT